MILLSVRGWRAEIQLYFQIQNQINFSFQSTGETLEEDGNKSRAWRVPSLHTWSLWVSNLVCFGCFVSLNEYCCSFQKGEKESDFHALFIMRFYHQIITLYLFSTGTIILRGLQEEQHIKWWPLQNYLILLHMMDFSKSFCTMQTEYQTCLEQFIFIWWAVFKTTHEY